MSPNVNFLTCGLPPSCCVSAFIWRWQKQCECSAGCERWPEVAGWRPAMCQNPSDHTFSDHVHVLSQRKNSTSLHLPSSTDVIWALKKDAWSVCHEGFKENVSGTAFAELRWHFAHDKKSRRAKCPNNRQLHATAGTSKSLPDQCSADQGEQRGTRRGGQCEGAGGYRRGVFWQGRAFKEDLSGGTEGEEKWWRCVDWNR